MGANVLPRRSLGGRHNGRRYRI